MPNGTFTTTQLNAFASLLQRSLTPGNINSLASAVLGMPADKLVGNSIANPTDFVRQIVDEMNSRGKIAEAISKVREQTQANTRLMVALTALLRGEELTDENLQKLVNEYEPFLSSKAIQDYLPKLLKTVCAVAVGTPSNEILGTGFLIGPDLVMTNYHVLETYLDLDNGKVKANGPGNQIFFFFDYLSTPMPDVPPTQLSGVQCVTAATDWLVHGRYKLDGDGTPNQKPLVNKEYDYVVVRLAAPIGERSSQMGGGGTRGWLELPTGQIDTLGSKKILVFQHPQKAPQQWDVGDFVQMDQTQSRVWYRVSTAHGSSGGAAIDSQGRLYALHNASVVNAPGAPAHDKLNQGIRIDWIADDLKAEVPTVLSEKIPAQDSALHWSLTNDRANLSPIIGRTSFREVVLGMQQPDSFKVLVVRGDPGCGRKYSVDLLRRTLGVGVPVAVFSPSDLEGLEPMAFLKALGTELSFSKDNIPDPPEALTTENLSRWIQKDLPKWLLERLESDQKNHSSKYPAWVVINTIKASNDRLLWANNLEDCIAALVGAHDPGTIGVEIPQLRWLFLASMTEVLPTGGVPQNEDDLTKQTDYTTEFAACFQLAYRALMNEEPMRFDELQFTAELKMEAEALKPQKEQLPNRKLLSTLVVQMIKRKEEKEKKP